MMFVILTETIAKRGVTHPVDYPTLSDENS